MNSNLWQILSKKGKQIEFPQNGIIVQTKEAEGKKINATLGMATDGYGQALSLTQLEQFLKLSPNESVAYAPTSGKQKLRRFWQEKIYEQNPNLKGQIISLPVITAGLTHGLSIATFLFCEEGDEVIMPDLHWENYELIFKSYYGAKLKTFPFFRNGRFNAEGLREAFSRSADLSRPVIVIFNFPNNPTGYTLTKPEVAEVKKILVEAAEAGKSIVVIVDDAYFGLFFEDEVFQESFFSIIANLHERILAIKIDGSSKEDFTWGLRVAFVTFGMKGLDFQDYEILEKKAAAVIRASVGSGSNLSQSLLLRVYHLPDYQKEKQEKIEILRKRYQVARQILALHPEYEEFFEILPFNSGYFVCLRPKNGIRAEAIKKILLEQYSTGVIVYRDILRVALCSVAEEHLSNLFTNLCEAARKFYVKTTS